MQGQMSISALAIALLADFESDSSSFAETLELPSKGEVANTPHLFPLHLPKA